MIIVGSSALKHFGYQRQEPKDLDVWCLSSEPTLRKTDSFTVSPQIYNLVPTKEGYATPDAIYTIKCSHFAHDIKWDKTKKDILWLKHKGCKLLPDLYKELKNVWREKYGDKSFLSLTKNKADFFNDHVPYKYDHDYLHSLVSHPNLPMYSNCLVEDEEVLISKKKFYAMPFADQLQMFKEEMTVIAIERWMVPYKTHWHKAYSLALKKTITNLTKNWATDFIISNLDYYVKPEYRLFKFALETINLTEINMTELQNMIVELHKELNIEQNIHEMVFNLSEGRNWFIRLNTNDYAQGRKEVREILKNWGYETLHCEGGGEGGAEECNAVFKLKDKVIQTRYSYYSHHGHDYDDILYSMKEVTPVEKTVTVYE
jgi:hypothetical protein